MWAGEKKRASLETLLESGELELPILHPGGLELTSELAEMCRAGPGKSLLDVASGTGESACHIAERFRCRVTGIDRSASLVGRAQQKARQRVLAVQFQVADAHRLPFAAGTFDAVISECSICGLDKAQALAEMVRVARAGGYVGIGDLYWKQNAPSRLPERLADLEGERPETMPGWVQLFENAGLQDLWTQDRSQSLPAMAKSIKRQLGLAGYAKIILTVLQRWGIQGLRKILQSEKLLRNEYLGYAIVVGRKP